ncbi:MAG: acetate/propionate family kinase [Actinomycetales bacterium]
MTSSGADRLVVLAINPGSSSLKAAVRGPGLSLEDSFDHIGTPDALLGALGQVADRLQHSGIHPDAVGHRVVHGGPDHTRTTSVDDGLIEDLRRVVPLAPLHLPTDLAVIEAARRAWADAVHVACFDTAFHAGLPEISKRLPVAAELAERGVRRYGFHGLSLQSVLRARPDLDNAVIAHLGSGCSVTAVSGGRSRHTTMSMTPTGGMVSATRSGDLDPEIVLYLIEDLGYDVPTLRELLDRHSGLAGVAAGRHDLRELLAAEADDENARLAVELFVRSTATAVVTCALVLDRFDTLVFTGGVGEHAAVVRERVMALLSRIGARPAETCVVAADEQIVIDSEVRRLLTGPNG